jgi:hypothetical protein
MVKTFGYPQAGRFKPLETRLLLHRASGWVALPYVWNAAGTDADLKRAGTRIPVTFTDPSGASRSISYAVPNQNQCKDCHALSGAIAPIGVKARYLNHDGQLEHCLPAGMLDRLPADAPRVARWDDPAPARRPGAGLSRDQLRALPQPGRAPRPIRGCSSNGVARPGRSA